MRRKVPLVDSVLIESFSAVLNLLKRYGYDGSMNVSDFYFANRQRLDPIIYGPNVHSNEFANLIRWHSLIGIECRKAIIEYFRTKIHQHKEYISKEWFSKITAMIADPDGDKKVKINPADLYVNIDFKDFKFQFKNRALRIRDFTYAFSLGRIGPQIDLIGIDLSGIKLESCRLVNLCFHRANFDNANLYQLELLHTTFSNVSFRHANLVSIRAKEGSFFNGADFTSACVFGIYPLGDSCLSEPFVFNEMSYFYLARLTVKRFFRIGLNHMVSQEPGHHTGFANNPTNELTLPATKSLKEYIIWYQRTLQKVDRLPSASVREGLAFLISVLTTKHWTSFSALGISAFCLILFFTGLYATFASHYAPTNVDPISLFYQSFLVFTSFGLEDFKPLSHLGRFLVISEIFLGYVTLAVFVYLLAKKIDRSY